MSLSSGEARAGGSCHRCHRWERLGVEMTAVLVILEKAGTRGSSSSIEKLGVGSPSSTLGLGIAAVTRGSSSSSSSSSALRVGNARLVIVVIAGCCR